MHDKIVMMYGGEGFVIQLRYELGNLNYNTGDPLFFTVLDKRKTRTKTIKRWMKEDEG